MSNYATKKELEHTTGFDTSDLAAKKFIALKDEANKLDINKLVNVPTSLDNLNTKVDFDKLKTVPVDLKFTKFNTLTTKVTALSHINECNTDKQNFDKKLEMLIKKYQIQLV